MYRPFAQKYELSMEKEKQNINLCGQLRVQVKKMLSMIAFLSPLPLILMLVKRERKTGFIR